MKDKKEDCLSNLGVVLFFLTASLCITFVLIGIKDLQDEVNEKCTKWETREKNICHTYNIFGYHTDCHVETEDYCVEYEGDKNDR